MCKTILFDTSISMLIIITLVSLCLYLSLSLSCFSLHNALSVHLLRESLFWTTLNFDGTFGLAGERRAAGWHGRILLALHLPPLQPLPRRRPLRPHLPPHRGGRLHQAALHLAPLLFLWCRRRHVLPLHVPLTARVHARRAHLGVSQDERVGS
jgi:hypothetical protein